MPNLVDIPRSANLWNEYDRDLYQRLPIYMAKITVDYIKNFSRWPKLLKGIPWKPNMGFTMRGVHKEKSPILRSQCLPNAMTTAPKKDVIEVREAKEDVQLYRQNFESNMFHFLPSFADFLTDSIDVTTEDITEKMMVYADQFYRTAIFHGAPYVWICGKAVELTGMPYWTSPTIALNKTQAVLAAILPSVTRTLDLANIQKIGTVMYNDIGVTPYSGSQSSDGTDGKGLQFKYCLVCGTEVWDNFINDSFLQSNRMLDLDIVTDGFTGSLFGRFTTLFERFELRIAADGTIPAPEVIEENSVAYDFGERKMNPPYVNAPYGVAFGCGGEGYKFINVGPPPKDFTGMTMKEFSILDWNGKVDVTKDLLINVLNENGVLVQDTNKRGEYLQLISDAVLGILPIRRRNIVPIIYKRARVGA